MDPRYTEGYEREYGRLVRKIHYQIRPSSLAKRVELERPFVSSARAQDPSPAKLGLPLVPAIRSTASAPKVNDAPRDNPVDHTSANSSTSGSGSTSGEIDTDIREAINLAFMFRDPTSGKPYTIVLHNEHFLQIFLSGEAGVRLKRDSGHPRESEMRQAYERAGKTLIPGNRCFASCVQSNAAKQSLATGRCQ